MKNILIAFFLLVIGISYSNAQSCTQRLKDAENEYEAGRLTGIPGLLKTCLDQGSFTKEEEIRARKLLTLVYIFMDEEGKADTALVSLLRKDPEHRVDPAVDPREFISFYNQFQVDPILRISIKLSGNMTSVNVIREFSNHGNEGVGEPKIYSNGNGIGLEATADKYLRKGFEIAGGTQFRLSNFNVVDEVTGDDALPVEYKVSMVSNRAPAMVRYILWAENKDKKLLPYILAGVSLDYLAKAGTQNTSRSGGIAFTQDVDYLNNHLMKRWNYSAITGVGAKFRVKNVHFFTVEARYDMGLKSLVDGRNRFNDQSSSFDLASSEYEYSTNIFSINVGYTLSLYNPKRITIE